MDEITTTDTMTLEEMVNEETGEEFTRAYLHAKFLSSVPRALYYARRRAGLTQEQLAEKAGKTQPGIARFEADHRGQMSLAQLAKLAFALDMVPRFELIPIEQAKAEVIQDAKWEIALRKIAHLSQELGLYE